MEFMGVGCRSRQHRRSSSLTPTVRRSSRRVATSASAGWGAIVFGVSPDGTHRRLLGAACAPCIDWMVRFRPPRRLRQRLSSPQQLQSDSCSKRRTPAPGCGVSVGIADSTCASAERASVSANAAMTNHARGACHDCADVLAGLGRRGLRWSPCLLGRFLHCVQ